MSRRIGLLIAVLLLVSFAYPQKKKSDDTFPRQILRARFVYVTAMAGDTYDRSVTADDRAAIADVQNAIKSWGRFLVTYKPQDADLIIAVRRGGVSVKTGGSGGTDSRGGRRSSVVLGGDAGPLDDTLMVFDAHGADPLAAPALWRRSVARGLQSPGLPLFRQFKDDAERAAKADKKP